MLSAESDTLWLYKQAGIDPEAPEGAVQLAQALGFAVVRHSGISRTAALSTRQKTIYVSPKARAAGVGFAVAHELAEWHLEAARYTGDDVEALADHLAGALVAPGPAVRLWLGEVGRNLPSLAQAFATTQSIMALRLGEVTGSPIALVTPHSVHVRGDDFVWGTEADVRRAAASPVPDGLELVIVSDAPRRRALIAT